MQLPPVPQPLPLPKKRFYCDDRRHAKRKTVCDGCGYYGSVTWNTVLVENHRHYYLCDDCDLRHMRLYTLDSIYNETNQWDDIIATNHFVRFTQREENERKELLKMIILWQQSEDSFGPRRDSRTKEQVAADNKTFLNQMIAEGEGLRQAKKNRAMQNRIRCPFFNKKIKKKRVFIIISFFSFRYKQSSSVIAIRCATSPMMLLKFKQTKFKGIIPYKGS